MNKKLFYTMAITAITVVLDTSICAQDLVFDPALLIPDSAGYYISGHIKDEVYYDSCTQEFQDFHHFETGTQLGFNYQNCMIMPTCPPKDDPPVVSLGYIQMTKARYLGTDSAVIGAIISQPVSNLTRLYLEVSPDVTPKTDRHVVTRIEYSLDDGATYEAVFAQYVIEDDNKKGDTITFLPSQDFAFEEICNASQISPVTLRVSAGVYTGEEDHPQRVRIHLIKIWADFESGIKDNVVLDELFEVRNNIIISKKGSVSVYNILGKLIGSGKYIPVTSGIFIVKTSKGTVHKVNVSQY